MWELKIKADELSQHCRYLMVLIEESEPGAWSQTIKDRDDTLLGRQSLIWV